MDETEAPGRFVFLLYKQGGNYVAGGKLMDVFATQEAAKESAEFWAKGEFMSLGVRLGAIPMQGRLYADAKAANEIGQQSLPLKWEPVHDWHFGPTGDIVAHAGLADFLIERKEVREGRNQGT